jgi:hypothetical protein
MAVAVEWKTRCWFVYWEISGKFKDEPKDRFSDYPLDHTSFNCAGYKYQLTCTDNMDYLRMDNNMDNMDYRTDNMEQHLRKEIEAFAGTHQVQCLQCLQLSLKLL